MMDRKAPWTRKLLCLALAIALCAVGMGASFETEDYTLPEKLQRQIDFGNGVKGAVMLSVTGDSPWAQMLAPFSGTQVQIRGIKSGEQFQVQLYTLSGETQVGLTQLYGDDAALYLRSALLPDLVLTYPTGGDWLDQLLGRSANENPQWLTAALKLLSMSDTTGDWATVLQPYYTDIELWLSGYAEEPRVIRQDDGETVMAVRYDIPAQALKDQMKALLSRVLSDEALLSLLQAQLSAEQQYAYLTPGLLYYYEAAIDALAIDGDVLLERDMSTRGDTLATEITLPLPQNDSGWTALTMTQGTDTRITLDGETQDILLEMTSAQLSESHAHTLYSGVVRVVPDAAGTETLAVAFSLEKQFSQSVDEDTRAHDRTTWQLSLAPASAGDDGRAVRAFEPISASLMTHIHSKNAKRNATTLEMALSYQQGESSVALSGSIVTASPWVLETLPTEGAENVAAMTDAYRGEILSQMLANAVAALSAINPSALPAVDATPTDLPIPVATTNDLN